MDRKIAQRFAMLPLAVLAGTSLSGCVAVAIPALAGSAMVGSRVVDGEDAPAIAASAPAAASSPAAVIKPAPVPTVTVAAAITAAPTPAPAPAPVTPKVDAPPSARVPAPAIVAPPAPSPRPALSPAPTTPAPTPATAPTAAAPRPAATTAASVGTAAAPIAYPDPARPLSPGQSSFARFVRYGQASALGAKGGADLLSAVLSDPIALDGKRRRCSAGEQQVALIDLDPVGGVFSPPATPQKQPGLALGLAVLREAGVEIAWMTDLSVNQSGALRTALEQSGLDPRGEDIISLRRDEADAKQQRKENLAGITCVIAIAGDERADFDGRYKYLRSPEAGAGLEPLIGNGWFLIEPLLGR